MLNNQIDACCTSHGSGKNIDQSARLTADSVTSIAIAVVMCGGIVARASHVRNSKLEFLLLLFSIAHLPLLRYTDAKILRGELVTSKVIIMDRLANSLARIVRDFRGISIHLSCGCST